MQRLWFRGTLFAFIALAGAGVFAACGGGGGGGSSSAPGQILPAASPTPCPSGYVGNPPGCTQEASLPGQFYPQPSPSATALPALLGYGGTIIIPAAQQATQVFMVLSSTVPTPTPAIPALGSIAHRSLLRHPLDSSSVTALIYITLSVTSGQVVFTQSSGLDSGFPGFTFTLPSGAGNGPFYLAWFENGTTWTTIAGPVSPSGGSVTLQPVFPSLVITPTTAVYLCLYTGGVVPSVAPSGSASPLPTSTTSPSAGPTSSSAASASPTSSPVSTNSPTTPPTTSPTTSPSSSPTLAPTSSPTATASPTAFPSSSPSPTPMPSSTAAVASFAMGTWPSGAWGTPISSSLVNGFEGLNSSGTAISGSETFSHAVTVSSNNSAVTLCLLSDCTPASSVTITSNSQAAVLAMSYNGNAITSATITASATGATSNSVTFTPASAAIVYTGNLNGSGNPEIDLYAPLGGGTGSTGTFTATQAGYSNITYTGGSACSTFATIAQSGSTFTVTAIASPVAGTCTITLDGFNGSTQNVIITYTSFGPIIER